MDVIRGRLGVKEAFKFYYYLIDNICPYFWAVGYFV